MTREQHVYWWQRHPEHARWQPWRCALRDVQRRLLGYLHPTREGRVRNQARHGGHAMLIWHYGPAITVQHDTVWQQVATSRCVDCFTEMQHRVSTEAPISYEQHPPDWEMDRDGHVLAVRLMTVRH